MAEVPPIEVTVDEATQIAIGEVSDRVLSLVRTLEDIALIAQKRDGDGALRAIQAMAEEELEDLRIAREPLPVERGKTVA